VFAILLFVTPRAVAQIPDGTLTSISGQVTITRGTAAPITAAYGTAVESGDRIVTGPGSKVTITLSNGTMQQLSESTTLTLGEGSATAANGRVTKVALLTGGAVTVVRFAKGASYEVRTPNAIVTDLSTSYECQYTKGVQNNQFPGCLEFTNVKVYDGTVEVRNSANPGSPVVAGAGDQVIAPCDLMATLVAGGFSKTELIAGGVIGLAVVAGTVPVAYCTINSCADFSPNE
jgi:hypothetical protein